MTKASMWTIVKIAKESFQKMPFKKLIMTNHWQKLALSAISPADFDRKYPNKAKTKIYDIFAE